MNRYSKHLFVLTPKLRFILQSIYFIYNYSMCKEVKYVNKTEYVLFYYLENESKALYHNLLSGLTARSCKCNNI